MEQDIIRSKDEIIAELKRRGLTKKWLARKSNYTEATVKNKLCPKGEPSLRMMIEFDRILELSN